MSVLADAVGFGIVSGAIISLSTMAMSQASSPIRVPRRRGQIGDRPSMRAVIIAPEPEGARYVLAEAPEPAMGPADLLVEVHASAINQADLRYASTHFAASESASGPAIGGLEMAGEVIALGECATGFAVGDRVMAMTGRAWAERVPVDHRLAIPVPSGFSWKDAAAVPVSYITAHDCVTAAARLTPGESLLVQGATSAAGLAVVQIARHVGAGTVFGTTSKEAKVERLRALGCDIPIVRGSVDVAETVKVSHRRPGCQRRGRHPRRCGPARERRRRGPGTDYLPWPGERAAR